MTGLLNQGQRSKSPNFQGHQTYPNIKVLINVYICIKFEKDITYSVLDIKENVSMLTDVHGQTNRQNRFIKVVSKVNLCNI